MRTQVGIVGAGPAGLMLSHLLHLRGVESVVIDVQTRERSSRRSRRDPRAGHGRPDAPDRGGRPDDAGRFVHHGINLAFPGGMHRINLYELSGGRSVMVYAQHEVLKDLIAKRLADGGDVRFGVTDTQVDEFLTEQPKIRFTHEGNQESLECDFVIGADGSRTMCRFLIPQPEVRTDFFRQYPFAWFGILAEAPPSSDELIYAHSDRGSCWCRRGRRRCSGCTSSATRDGHGHLVGRPDLGGVRGAPLARRSPHHAGEHLPEGRAAVPSFVCEPMQYGRLFLAGDSAHTVPPTGAKGLNLAMADVHVLDRALGAYYDQGHRAAGVLHADRSAPGVAGAVVLVLDDLDVAPLLRRQRLRPAPPGGRAGAGHQLAHGRQDPGRQLHGTSAGLIRRTAGSHRGAAVACKAAMPLCRGPDAHRVGETPHGRPAAVGVSVTPRAPTGCIRTVEPALPSAGGAVGAEDERVPLG